SDKSGMRVVIELKRGEVPEVVLNNLYKSTQLQDNFGMNMVALVDNQPRLLNLKQMLEYFLQHRREVVTRRTIFELRKARERGHVLEGLAVALANIDEFIAIIKAAANPVVARQELMSKAWDSSMVREMLARAETDTPGGRNAYRPEGLLPEYGMQATGLYRLSDSQAQEILQMRLQRLTGLEQDKIVNEYKEVMSEISDLLDLLAKPERVTSVIESELKEVQAEFGIAGGDSGRRSFIEMNATELFTEDLITPQDMVVTLSNTGYMKSQPLSEYRAQKRGGRGKQAAATKNEDWIETLFVANTHDIILCFSDRGRMYWLKVWEVPQGSRNARGKPIVNMFPLIEGEKITVILPIKGYQDDHYVFMATSLGTVKKTRLSDFSNPRKAGIIAVDLNENDFLVGAAITDGQHDVMLFSDAGKAVRFDENDVRPMGRTARGVRGMNLGAGHQVIAMLVAVAEAEGAEAITIDAEGNAIPSSVLTATENGFGKRTPIAEYTRHGRGTKGMIAIQTSERNGKVVAAALVSPEDQIMLITTGGILVRTRVSEIREMGRATQGVTLINVDEGTRLSGLQRIAESDSDDENDIDDGEEGDVAADPAVDSSTDEAGDA
ncbi:MAG: DNA gyrase C-terminal beta-propeller domain-containing protein, partial [Polynucleobacter sp.]